LDATSFINTLSISRERTFGDLAGFFIVDAGDDDRWIMFERILEMYEAFAQLPNHEYKYKHSYKM
jgi:hypothetical protein